MAGYIIIGGHGKIALQASALLVEAGHAVTSVIRDPDQAAGIEATGAVPLVLDVETAPGPALVEAFTDQDAVIWSAGAGGGNPTRTYAVDRDAAIASMDAAVHAGVNRYLMVSYFGAGPGHGVAEDDPFYPYAQSKAEADAYLRATGLDWTILGPTALTDASPTGRIRLGPIDDPSAVTWEVSRANVARAIVASLEIGNTIGKTLDFIDGDTEIREAFVHA